MLVKRKQLTETVIITGKNFFGEPCCITFTPHEQNGWWWDTKYNGIVPIDHRIARYKKGRIQLFVPGETLNVWEHLGPLRFLGIDGVKVRMDFDSWPPYIMAGQYEMHFIGKIKETEELIPTIYVKEEYQYFSHNYLFSEVVIKPSDQFLLHVLSRWENLPEKGTLLDEKYLLSQIFLKNVFKAKPQGLSTRKFFAKMWQVLYGWPHFKNVAWKNDFDTPEDAAYAWWLHAVQDALGEISLASHEALPVGMFFRFKVGHKQMLIGIQKSFS